jgi:hypothetical protein
MSVKCDKGNLTVFLALKKLIYDLKPAKSLKPAMRR